jgi:hypothetical protein
MPAVVTLGSTVDSDDAVSFPITGWRGGAMTKCSVQYG